MPFVRSSLMTGLTSLPTITKSPVIAAFPPPVGWKLIAVLVPSAGGTAMPCALICSARGMLN